jgi:putative nucleotidyltransferase with HDIG domain
VQKQQWRSGAGKMLFNLTNSPLAAAVAGGVYVALRPGSTQFTVWHLLAAVAAVNAYYVTNVGTIALLISLHSRRPLVQVVRDAAWFAPFHILLGVTGAFLAGAHAQLTLLGSVMFVVPVLLMRFTLAFYARRSQRAIETLEVAKTEVEQAHLEKEATLRQLIETVGAIIDARDNAVAGHSQRVARYAVALGAELGLSATEQAYLHTAGLLHDLGKVAVPETILHKPAKLTPEEYEIIKQHAPTGERILAEVGPLGEVARMVGEHHERYNGSGYPAAKRGEAISIGGRVLAVADTLDSILSDRPYAQGKPLPWALDEIDRCAGTLFDPVVAAALHRLVQDRGPEFFFTSPRQTVEALRELELVS